MNRVQSSTNYSRDNFGRTAEEVPLFPFSQVRMILGYKAMDSIEEAQYDFVKQAGLPSSPPTPKQEDES